MGRAGKLDITIDYVRLLNGEKAQLRGVKEGKGGGHTGAMTGAIVATALVVWPAAPFFLFMHGKDINIPKDTPITAYVDGDFTINAAPSSVPTVTLAPASALQTPTQTSAPVLQPAPQSSNPMRAAVPAQTQPQVLTCLSVVVDSNGNETCTKYATKQ